MHLNMEACAEPTSAGVWWRDDADWKQYDAPQAAAIQRGIADEASNVGLGYVISSKHPLGARYEVDLSTMKQINLVSGYTRDVKVVKAPATSVASDCARIKEEIWICRKSICNLKNMIRTMDTELAALRLKILKDRTKRVEANIASTKQMLVDGLSSNLRRASCGVSKDGYERCDAGEFRALEHLSEDDC